MFFRKKTNPREMPLSPDEILLRMENFCAFRERCPKEVRAKLTELGARGDLAQDLFDTLLADRYFDENRFAMAYAGGKFRNNQWGKVRIRLELRVRDISPEIIDEALAGIETEEYEKTLFKLLQKKRLQYAGDERSREKTAAALIRTGYEPELVFKFLNKSGLE